MTMQARACPICGADSVVYNTRVKPGGLIERRRRCQVCGAKFVTVERFDRLLERRNDYGSQKEND